MEPTMSPELLAALREEHDRLRRRMAEIREKLDGLTRATPAGTTTDQGLGGCRSPSDRSNQSSGESR